MSGAATRENLRPLWLRPATLALVVSAHVSALLLFRATVEPPPSLESLQVELVPEGDSVADQKPQAEVKPEQAKPQQQPAPPPAQAAPLAAPPPQQEAPEAPPLPIAKPEPPKPSVQQNNQPSPAQQQEIQRNKLAEQRRKDKAREERRREAQEARQEAHSGVANGARRASGMSQANFAGLVVAQLNRHKFYPAAARAAGISGSVGVAFTIGPSGRVVSQSVTRSSGNGALDSAARVILSSIHTPPPPGGRFSTRTNINFQRR
jgi:protein TonB